MQTQPPTAKLKLSLLSQHSLFFTLRNVGDDLPVPAVCREHGLTADDLFLGPVRNAFVCTLVAFLDSLGMFNVAESLDVIKLLTCGRSELKSFLERMERLAGFEAPRRPIPKPIPATVQLAEALKRWTKEKDQCKQPQP